MPVSFLVCKVKFYWPRTKVKHYYVLRVVYTHNGRRRSKRNLAKGQLRLMYLYSAHGNVQSSVLGTRYVFQKGKCNLRCFGI